MNDYSYFLEISNWSVFGLIGLVIAFLMFRSAFKSGVAEKGYFLLALALIYLALGSPISTLSTFGLHSVAMLQQFFILMIVPVLILKSIPGQSPLAKSLAKTDFSGDPSKTTIFWIIGAIAMWGGHFLSAAILSSKTGVAVCGMTVPSDSWIGQIPEILVMAFLLISGFLFALPVFHPDRSKRIAPLIGVMYLFTACVSCSVLGIYVAFSASSASAEVAIPFFTTFRNPIPMSPRTDQELAGMLMWVPGCLFYVVASMGILQQWFNDPQIAAQVVEKNVITTLHSRTIQAPFHTDSLWSTVERERLKPKIPNKI